MPFISVPNTIQANLRLTWQGQEVENVFHFLAPGAVTPADLAAVAEGVEDWWVTNMPIMVNADCVYREVYAVDLTTQTGGVFTASGGSGTPGTASSPSLPNHCTIAVSFRTAFRGRSYRGRAYHIGLTEAQVTGNAVVPSIITLLNSTYSLLLNTANFGGCALAIASRRLNNAPRVIGVATEVIDVVLADDTVDSQRRRLPGRGR